MNLTVERWYPCVGGVVSGATFFWFQRHFGWSYPATMPNVLSSVTNVSAIAIGILGTSQFILLAMDDNDFIKRLRVHGYLEPIMTYLMNAIHWSFWLAIISALGMLADPNHSKKCFMPCCSIWILLLVSSALSYYRIITIFAAIVRKGLHPADSAASVPPLPVETKQLPEG